MTSPTLILPERSHVIASDLRAAIGVDKSKDDYSTLTAYAVDCEHLSDHASGDRARGVRGGHRRHGALCRTAGHPADAASRRDDLTGSANRVRHHSGRLAPESDSRAESRRGLARVQPGIVLAELNKQLARERSGYLVPIPRAGDMCKLGGMLATTHPVHNTLR